MDKKLSLSNFESKQAVKKFQLPDTIYRSSNPSITRPKCNRHFSKKKVYLHKHRGPVQSVHASLVQSIKSQSSQCSIPNFLTPCILQFVQAQEHDQKYSMFYYLVLNYFLCFLPNKIMMVKKICGLIFDVNSSNI